MKNHNEKITSVPIISSVSGRGLPLPGNDIDTDRILPARFLKCVTFDELGKYAFYDERFYPDGTPKEHPLNDSKYKGATILIVNRNFGCGSSREHAPQSLKRFGFQAILGESFAEIFADNCIAIGLPVAVAEKSDILNLMSYVRENPQNLITLNFEKQEVIYGDFNFPLFQREEAKRALLQGTWDSTSVLLSAKDEIQKVASKIPYMSWLSG